MNWILCIFVLLLSSCGQKTQERHYTEIVIQSPQVATSSSTPMFTWDTPQGWKQEDSEGMRLATFHLLSDEKAIDCSIVALGGMAGGVEANLRRWMGQIGVEATDDELSAMIDAAPSTSIKSGQEAKIFDFLQFQSKSQLKGQSMIVAMVAMDDTTLFVKMTGTMDTVAKNKDNFLKLLGSITRK